MLTTVTIVLFVLKVLGIAQISWAWVIIPTLLEAVLVLLITVFKLAMEQNK